MELLKITNFRDLEVTCIVTVSEGGVSPDTNEGCVPSEGLHPPRGCIPKERLYLQLGAVSSVRGCILSEALYPQ